MSPKRSMADKTSGKSDTTGSRAKSASKPTSKSAKSKAAAKPVSKVASKSAKSKLAAKSAAKKTRKAGAKSADLQSQVQLLTEKIATLEKNIQQAASDDRPKSAPTEIRHTALATRRQKAIPVYEVKEVHPSDLEIRGTDPLGDNVDGLQISLLDRARIQWLMGDWGALSTIDLDQIESHQDGAELALFGAIGRVQTANLIEARKYLSFAKKRGCSSKLIQAILLSGIHSSMYSANLIKGCENKALRHKSELKKLGAPDVLANIAQQLNGEQSRSLSDLKDASRLLIVETYQNLAHAKSLNNNSERALNQIKSTRKIIDYEKNYLENHFECPSYLESAEGNSCNHTHPPFQLRQNSVILVAGMRHSGSTALFNIIRLGLEKSGHRFVSGYSEHDFLSSKVRNSGCIGLIKTHEFRDDVHAMADVIFTTKRDLRDTVASAVRRDFQLLKKIGNAIEYAKYNRSLYDLWQAHSHYEFIYEEFIKSPSCLVAKVIEFLQLDKKHVESICAEVLNLPKDDYQKTLLTESHITDPERKKIYTETLPKEIVSMINANNYIWLKKHYPKKVFSI